MPRKHGLYLPALNVDGVKILIHLYIIIVYSGSTCALWEARYVRISEGVLTLERVGEHAQSGPADDGHLGAVLSLSPQPIGCLLVFVVTADGNEKETFKN